MRFAPRDALVAVSVLLGLVGTLHGGEERRPRLAYPVEALNHAMLPEFVQPGANGTSCALGLRVSGSEWARWNFPRVEPKEGREGVTCCIRSVGKSGTAAVRLVEVDGNEWNSGRLALTSDWQRVRLTARNFQFFRGTPSRKGSVLDLRRVVQIQFVLTGGKAGAGIDIDEVAFDPPDTRFTFESAEQRFPPSASEARRRGVHGVLSALNAEQARMEVCRQWARRCTDDLQRLLADRKTGESYEAFASRHSSEAEQRRFAFQQSPSLPERNESPLGQADADLAPLKPAKVPEAREVLSGDTKGWRASTLYATPKPSAPAVVKQDGKTGVELRARFSAGEVRQVVFLDGPTVVPLNLDGYGFLEADVQLEAGPLNEKTGLALRLANTTAKGATYTFVDIAPENLAPASPGKWTVLRFPLRAAQQNDSFDTTQVTSLRFRFENTPGKASEIRLAVAALRLVPADPEALAAEQMIREAWRALETDRLALWRDLENLYAMRKRAWDDPVVQRFVLRAQLEPAPTTAGDSKSNRHAPALTLEVPQDAVQGRLEVTPTLAPDGSGQVSLRWKLPTSAEPLAGKAQLLDHQDQVVAATELSKETSGTLHIAAPRRWSPGYPYLYRVRSVVYEGSKAVAAEERPVGFRRITAGASDLAPTLRHAWQPSVWDGTMRLNGQPYFPNGACYHLPHGKTIADVAPLLRDLWVEALRYYGWSFHPHHWQAGDQEGIGSYASLAPAYKTMVDPLTFQMGMEAYCRQLTSVLPELRHPSILNVQIGNEVELNMWGADLSTTSPEAMWLPLEQACNAMRAIAPDAPITYVRAGRFQPIPPLPGEDLVGLNQYTGRYGGRIEQIGARLDLAARQCQSTFRALGINEWNGPQYSWASRGIGGVTERGAAYYLQRYYETMIDTPGIALSSEFTLNWVLWRVEDLTTHSREEEWRDRPPYAKFGGGYTADHVPAVPLEQVYRGPAYRAMQAFQSPLYPLLRTPGKLVIAHGADGASLAHRLATALAPLGKDVACQELTDKRAMEAMDAHLIVVGGVGAQQPDAVRRLEQAGWLDPTLDGFPSGDHPLIQRRIHPYFPTRGLVAVSGSTEAGRAAGIERLIASARGVEELWSQEGAMVRAVALVDSNLKTVYEQLLFEFVGRGHLLGGDDTRTKLDVAEFLAADGSRRPAWWNLNALVLDTKRKLEASEMDAVRKLARANVRVVISLPCYQANPELQRLLQVSVGGPLSLCDSIESAVALRGPVPVVEVGQVQKKVVEEFVASADLQALEARELTAANGQPAARTRQDRRSVAVRVEREGGHYAVLGYGIGAVAELHRRVTGAGRTHSIYDRDTASGLERPGRLAINLCLEGMPQPQIRPRLHAVARIDEGILKPGGSTALVVRLLDNRGQLVTGASVRAQAQPATDGQPRGSLSEPVDLAEVAPGVYRCPITLGQPPAANGLAVDCSDLGPDGMHALSVQIRAIAPGTIPWEGGASAWIATESF